jgi:hypothetical protein
MYRIGWEKAMDEPIEVSIEYPSGATNNASLVTPLGNGRYRLEEDPLSCFMADSPRDLRKLPNYGDVFEAEAIAARALRFVKVVERARLKRFQFPVSRDFVESPELNTILSKVESLNGYWERVFGGILIIYLPEDSDYDPSEELKNMSRYA